MGPCILLQLNRLHVPTLPMTVYCSMRQDTPMQSPVRGGVFTSSRPPSAMDARFDDEVHLIDV